MIIEKGKKVKKFLLIIAIFAFITLSFFAVAITAVGEGEVNKKSDIFTARGGVVAIKDNVELPSFANKGNGVEISTDGFLAEVEYSGIIDARECTQSKNFVAFQILSENGEAFMQSIEFVMTDVNNPDNTVSMLYNAPVDAAKGYPYGESYAKAGYNKMYRGASEVDPSHIWNGIYGTTVYGNSFCGSQYSGLNTFKFQFDYAKKTFFVNNGGTTVLNLGNIDHVGKDLWLGFSEDTFKLNIIMKFNKPTTGGIIATELLGQDLSGEFQSTDKKAPTINIHAKDEYIASMPNAVKDIEYRLPRAYAFDWYNGAQEANVKVSYNGTDVEVADNKFVPKSVGEYKIVYSLTNKFNLSSNKEIIVITDETMSPYQFIILDKFVQPKMLETFKVPKISVSGGSGDLTVTEELTFAGSKIKLPMHRMVSVASGGFYQHTVRVKGYVGNEYSKTYYYEVVLPEISILVEDEPKFLKNGINILPDFIALSKTGKTISKAIFVDGTKIPDDRKFTVAKNAGEMVALRYVANDGVNEVLKEFSAKVYAPLALKDFMIAENATVGTSEEGTTINAVSDAKVEVINSISADNLRFRFKIPSDKNNFDKLDIILKDDTFLGNYLKLSLTPCDAATSYIQIAGTNIKYTIPGSFSSGAEFNFIIDARNGEVKTADNSILRFEAWANFAARLDLELGYVRGQSAVTLIQISNQVLREFAYEEGDKTSPVITFSDYYSYLTEVSINRSFTLPRARSFDFLDLSISLNVEIKDTDGNIIFSGVPNEVKTFKADKYGFYVARYTATDSSNNTVIETLRFRVIDEVPPLLNVVGSIKASIKKGESVTVPTATATDNISESCVVQAYVFNKASYSMEIVALGSSYTFLYAGTYELVIYARDDAYNTARQVYTISVSA